MELLEILTLMSLGVGAYLFLGKELKFDEKFYNREEMRRSRNYLMRKTKVTQR